MDKEEKKPGETGESDDFSGWAMGSPDVTRLESDEDENDDGDEGPTGDESESEDEGEGESRDSNQSHSARESSESGGGAATPASRSAQESDQAGQYTEQDYLKGVGLVDDELEKLAAKYENGEIEFGEYRKQERALLDDRGTLQHAAANLRVGRERQERDWELAATAFAAKPENQFFRPGQPMAGMMKEVLERKFSTGEQRGKSYATILDESATEIRNSLRAFMGLEPELKGGKLSPQQSVDELKARREQRLASATSTPAKSGKPAESPNPNEGWAARW